MDGRDALDELRDRRALTEDAARPDAVARRQVVGGPDWSPLELHERVAPDERLEWRPRPQDGGEPGQVGPPSFEGPAPGPCQPV